MNTLRYITDTQGRKYFYVLHTTPPDDVVFWLLAKPIARIRMIWRAKYVEVRSLNIYDIEDRNQGLGSAILQLTVQFAQGEGKQWIEGELVPTHPFLMDDLKRFCIRNGCEVKGTKATHNLT